MECQTAYKLIEEKPFKGCLLDNYPPMCFFWLHIEKEENKKTEMTPQEDFLLQSVCSYLSDQLTKQSKVTTIE